MKESIACAQLEQRRSSGFVLVEIMAAALLAVLLIVPLASSMQRLVTTARDMRSQAASLSRLHDEEERGAWTWGPAVTAAAWELGPELKVRIVSGQSGKAVLGVWADGWSLREWQTESGSEIVLSGANWPEVKGHELVLRVRRPEGPWGPPWRTIVPDSWGYLPQEGAAPSADDAGAVWTGGEDSTVVHVPSLCTPTLVASWATAPVNGNALGLCLSLAQSGTGWCEVRLGNRGQSWYSLERAGLDVYF